MISQRITRELIQKAEKVSQGTGVDKRISMLLSMLFDMLRVLIKKQGGEVERLKFEKGLLLRLDKKILYPLIFEEEGPLNQATLKGYAFPLTEKNLQKNKDKIFVPILVDKVNITAYFLGFGNYQQLMSKSVINYRIAAGNPIRMIRAGSLPSLLKLVKESKKL